MVIEPINNRLYTIRFFLLFGALFAFMSGYSLMVHLGKSVVNAGGDIATVSNIFGFGMLGSFLTRPFVGHWIDRFGSKPIIIISTVAASLAILFFQWAQQLWTFYALRILLQLSYAAFLAAIAVLAAQISPRGRSAESLAMIGIGGLAGMMLGPAIGDYFLSGENVQPAAFASYFLTGAVIMFGALVFLIFTRSPARSEAERHKESYIKLCVKYWPGSILIAGLSLSLVQTVPILFIERFVIERGLGRVAFFFLAYSSTAIILRLILRGIPQRIGRKRTLVSGILLFSTGIFLLLGVDTEAGLIIPACIMGSGHCFSYPFLVDLAADAMPVQHRGVATSIILGTMDIGFLLGFVTQGYLIKYYGFEKTLACIALTATAGILYYAWRQRPRVDANGEVDMRAEETPGEGMS